MLTVRYIGPDAAILGGTYIHQGETRTVSIGQLLAALEHHPEAHFEIVSGELPQVEVEPLTPPATSPDDHPPTADDQTLAAEEPAGEDEPAIVEPIVEEPAAEVATPTAPAARSPRRRSGR